MATLAINSAVRTDPYLKLVEQLQCEFGFADVTGLANEFVAAEAPDFHWQARVKERYLGQWTDTLRSCEDGSSDLARVAVLSFLGGRWHAASCVVDGEGQAVDLLWLQSFDDLADANCAFDHAR